MGQKQTSLASWKFSRRACQSLNIWLWQFGPWFALIDFPPLEWGAVMGLNLATITRAPQCYCFSIIPLLSCTCTRVHAVRACVRPSSHEVIKVPLIKPCPQINHLHAQVCSCKLNSCTHTLQAHKVGHADLESLYQMCTQAHAVIYAHSYAYVPSFKHQWFDISFRALLFMTRHLSPCGLCSLRSKNQLYLLHTLQTCVPLLPLSLLAPPLDCRGLFLLHNSVYYENVHSWIVWMRLSKCI